MNTYYLLSLCFLFRSLIYSNVYLSHAARPPSLPPTLYLCPIYRQIFTLPVTHDPRPSTRSSRQRHFADYPPSSASPLTCSSPTIGYLLLSSHALFQLQSLHPLFSPTPFKMMSIGRLIWEFVGYIFPERTFGNGSLSLLISYCL